MSNRTRDTFLAIVVGGYAAQLYINHHNADKREDLDTRITALEQSQCVAKDSKVHADVKFEACMSQLRGKTQ